MAAAFALLASSCHDGGQRGVGAEPMAQIAVEKHAEILSLPIEVKAKRVTIQEGLPSNVVSDMQQDQKGFLWFSTHNGLARYDGNVVTTYLDNDSTGVSALIGRTKKALEDVTYKKLWVYSSSERLTCLNMVDGKEEKYCQEVEKLHFTKWKLVCDGMFWLWGAKDGAMLVDYRSGSFLTRRFAKAEIGSSRVPLIDSLDKDNVVLCTTDKVFLYSEGRLFCIAKGMRMSRTRPFHHKMLMVSEKGDVYVLRQGKLQRFSHVAYVDGEVATGDLLMGNRWILFTNRRSFSIDVRTGEVAECEGEWLIPNGRVLTDNKGRKWIYNKTGVLRLVRQDKLVPLILFPQQTTNYIDYERFHIVEDNHGLIWISTYGKGLFVFNHDLNQGQHFVANEKGESPIASNYLLCITADRRDGVWVSAEYGGVSHLQVMDKGVVRIFPNGRENLDLSNVVRMVKKQRDGSVMVGTRDGCLYHYSADMAQMLVKSHFDSNIYSVVEMPQGRMWIGTRGKGIYGIPGLDFKNKKVFCLKPDDRGRMWIGTFGEGLSVAIPRGEGYEVKTFFADSVGLNEVRCLAIDRKGMLWGGTSGGLFCVDPTRFAADGKGLRVYKRGSEIHDMLVDRQGRLWLTVPGEGLVCMQDGNFRILDASQGLINNMVQSVVETEDGNLWVSTQQGVSCWKAKDNSFDNYLFSRVMMGNVYNENSAVCLDDGRVLLGGNYGLTIINPSRISHVKGQTSVVFTSHPYSDEMTLSYEERSPKINFSTLDYSDVNNVKYTYWLEGYDSSWSVPSPTPWVNYQNLPFGSYRLHVKASYSDGIWGKESVLDISVEPPFYLSVWAWVFYALFLTVVIVMVVKSIREKNILKGKIKFEQELIRYKLVFFTNIAHEFRTPLTLIQGSLEKEKRIMKTNHWQLELEKTVRTMDKSVQRMLRLIDQLLEFRKLQTGKLKLSLQETDVVMFVQGICKMFDDAAESKQIDFKFESQLPAYLMYLDQQKMDKVVFNLLSNAFKYTHAKGTISVSLSFTDVMTIRVADTGVGIPQEKREQLFSRFMQSSYTGESFGIGLHLTHELVRTHHGEITYQENEGGGSVFVVTIPLQKDCYEASDFLVKDSPILKADLTKERDGQEEKTTDAVPSAPSAPLNRRTILLIEDDNDVREFLLSELESCFDLKVASDGKAGIAMAKELDVDLIVSDVMMPGMNGFELTKRLKNSFETSHIPIILLTALSTDENVLEGTESGADAYITKPFSPQLLMARILQLLNQREILRQKFGKVPQEIRSAMLRNEQDSLFVKRLDSIVYSRLGEQDLSVDKVAGLLHLGRTIFYKKVRGTTGYTPNEYIRVIRLRKAAELLKESEKNVSEVAYAVGFDNPYYFSKCFKEQFGMPPSQYRS